MSFHHIFINKDNSKKSNRKVEINTINKYSTNKSLKKQILIELQKSTALLFPKINVREIKIQSIALQPLCSNQSQINSKSKKDIKNKTLYKITADKKLQQDNFKQPLNDYKIVWRLNSQYDSSNNENVKNNIILEEIQKSKKQILKTSINLREKVNRNNGDNGNKINSNNPSQRIIKDYTINKLLGKGGFAQVYQATHIHTNVKYAIKQYNLAESFECFKNQTNIGQHFFSQNNQKEQKFTEGKQNIVRFVQKIKMNKKGYIIQQLCGINFSKLISQIKGTFHNKERVYQVNFHPFYEKLKDKNIFKSIIFQICQGIKLLNRNGFIHCDLKLQNILIQAHLNQENKAPQVKIIDFGSTFQYEKGLPKITITPQYMPPQLLAQFQKNKQAPELIQYDKIDVWSIGCILLQIFTGIPLWFKYKCKIQYANKHLLQLSIYALTNRDYSKIIKKQKQLCSGLLNQINFTCNEFQIYRKILKKIFVFDPSERINIDNLMKQFKEI